MLVIATCTVVSIERGGNRKKRGKKKKKKKRETQHG
jgi:hypothetical protein